MGDNIYILLSDMNLNIRMGTAGYNNEIHVSDNKLHLGINEAINIVMPNVSPEKVEHKAPHEAH